VLECSKFEGVVDEMISFSYPELLVEYWEDGYLTVTWLAEGLAVVLIELST
jgi:hypothetical protein